MKIAIIIGVIIALFVFCMSPDFFSGEALSLTILLAVIAGVGYLISLLKQDQGQILY